MILKKKIRGFYKRFVVHDIVRSDSVPNVYSWKKYLEKKGNTSNPFQASYNKYLCRMKSFGIPKKIVLNILSAFYLAIFRSKMVERKASQNSNHKTLLFIKRRLSSVGVFPNELKCKYNNIIEISIDSASQNILTQEAKEKYRYAFRKHFLHPYYLLMLKRELSIYSYYTSKYDFTDVISYDNERDVGSPIITDLLEKKGKKYIAFMHGEYLLQIIHAYMCFSEYYIWDKMYESMFRDVLKCGTKKFVVYTPDRFKMISQNLSCDNKHFLTYYLSGESKKTLIKLASIFLKCKDKGLDCKVRPHPRYSHYDLVYKLFDSSMIEDVSKVAIDKSFIETENIVGLNSTVLSEAFYKGRQVYIDNITDIEHYRSLKERYYIGLERKHKLFSDLLKENNVDF